MTHLHFTFGPVQSFVAQARRTRDLYAGSFLLSHLAMAAMAEAEAAGGKVILPDYSTLKSQKTEHAIAPNRFLAEFPDEAAAVSAAKRASDALLSAWQNITEHVWKNFLDSVAAQDNDTRAIWDRQITAFWEIAWAVGKPEESNLLDRRKNWRTPRTPIEGGDHCTLMGQWQELSGFIRSQEGGRQEAFWQKVRKQPKVKKLDLEDDERLCAIAFVKRFFPQVSNKAIERELDMQSWPSTVTVAAIPWLRVIKDRPKVHADAKAYAELVGNEPGARVSSARRFAALKNFPPAAGDFATLSGNFLNRTALENKRGTPLTNEDRRALLLKELHKLEEATGDRAGNFYALLLMDGDRMGALLRKHTARAVTPCLTKFASEVPGLIENEHHSGRCIYAGGDDLMAMLPLDHALEAVTAVRELYRKSFVGEEKKITASISAGLVFAHYRCAFSRVLEHAHHLLNTVAKGTPDKDALAIGVIKPGGVTCQWVSKFNHFIGDGSNCFAPLIEAYRRGERHERDGLSASFLYNLRERFGELFDNADERPCAADDKPDAAPADPLDAATLEALFVAEYLHGRREKNDTAKSQRQSDEAKQLMQQLLKVCYQGDPRRANGRKRFDLAGARFVKFLALDGKEGAE
jgi:CRISPR-associated protein Cmr2